MTWNTNDPDFTPCFQRTILVWLPCTLLWLFSLLDVYYIKNSIHRNIPQGFLNISKIILTMTLLLLSIIDLIVTIVNSGGQGVYPVDYYTLTIKIATFVSIHRIQVTPLKTGSRKWSDEKHWPKYFSQQIFFTLEYRRCQLYCWSCIANTIHSICNHFSGSFYWCVAFHNWGRKFGGATSELHSRQLINTPNTIS